MSLGNTSAATLLVASSAMPGITCEYVSCRGEWVSLGPRRLAIPFSGQSSSRWPQRCHVAPGIDRIAAGKANIREVIAFPKTQAAFDPLTGAPAPVDQAQLSALHIRSTAPRKL
jgi:hypothetical protein